MGQVSPLRHGICGACWEKRCAARGEPGRVLHRLTLPPEFQDGCCYCPPGETTVAEGYLREEPHLVPCGGNHPPRPEVPDA